MDKLPMMAEMEQYFASLFAVVLRSPDSCSPVKTSLCTCPRLPNTKTTNLHWYPRPTMVSSNGWYFNILQLKHMSIYRSKEHPISISVTVLLSSLMMVMSGLFGKLFMSTLMFSVLNQWICTALCLYMSIDSPSVSLILSATKSTSLSCLAV